MKSFISLAFLLAGACASAIPGDILDKRQFGGFGSFGGGGGSAAKAAVILKKLQPEYNPNATRAVYMYGPFKLPPKNATHGVMGLSSGGIKLDPNSDNVSGAIQPPCRDCTVYKAMANFAYKDGKQADVANGVYTHHTIIMDFAGKALLMPPVQPPSCPNRIFPSMSSMGGMGGNRPASAKGGSMPGMPHKRDFINTKSKRQFSVSWFIGGGGSGGSGNPFSPRPGSSITSGYWIGKGGDMRLMSELVNYDPVEKEIYLTLDVEWTPGKDPKMLDVGMGVLSADRCADTEMGLFHPPKDKAIVYKGDEWKIAGDGYFMNFTPHIHDGGVNIKVFVNNKEVCEAKALYGDDGGTTNAPDGKKWQTITGYTPCDTPVPVKRGDKVYITSEYDLTKHRLRPDNTHVDAEAAGMALANFIFARPFAASKGLFG